MPTLSEILHPTPAGLYCPPGNFYVDPTRSVERAIITHGHADHARAGHEHVLATEETLCIMKVRYGENFAGSYQALKYKEPLKIRDVTCTLYPAGHILGSAQLRVEQNGRSLVVSGDYKRSADPTCPPFEPVPCNVFITEATFALPVFRFPEPVHEIRKLLTSLEIFAERTHLLGAYSLGKAQRVISLLREQGFDAPIYVHGALERLNALYHQFGNDLGLLRPASEFSPSSHQPGLVVAPPSSLNDRWSRRFKDPVTSFASGWMAIRARARQRGVELPLILSDHADWPELTQTIREVDADQVWVTHGRDDALLRHLELEGRVGRPLSLVGYNEEDDDAVDTSTMVD